MLDNERPDWKDGLLCETLVELLRLRQTSTRRFHYVDDRLETVTMTYGDMCRDALRYAAVLRAQGVRAGDRVVIMLPTCPEYLFTFFGVVAMGAVPVPVYPPFSPRQLGKFIDTLSGIVADCRPTAIVYWSQVKDVIGALLDRHPELTHALALGDFAQAPAGDRSLTAVSPEETALIQYTSGSTSQPKGVELSHSNLLHNMKSNAEHLQMDPERDRGLSWLPLYHDMGLIGALLSCMYIDLELFLMAPQTFVMRPRLWLQAISKFKATITVAPNFAYNLVAKSVSDKALEGVDLSSVRVWMCAAEPIQLTTFEDFRRRFEPHGFRADGFFCAYGLAETSLTATFPPIHQAPTVFWIDRDAMEREHRAIPGAAGQPGSQAVFGLGRPIPGARLRIADPGTGAEVPDGAVGEVLLASPSVMKGYYGSPEKSAEAFQDGWLRTGDLGFIHDGQLFLCGRHKDIIIRRGRNYYPADIEHALEAIDGLRKGCAIAFSHTAAGRDTEELVILAETRQHEPAAQADLATAIKAHLAATLGFAPDRVVLLPPNTLLKTSSGKLRRRPTRDLYLSGGLRPGRDRLLDQLGIVMRSRLAWGKRFLRRLVG